MSFAVNFQALRFDVALHVSSMIVPITAVDDYFQCRPIRVTRQAQNDSDAGDCISAEGSLCLEPTNQPQYGKSYMVGSLKVQRSGRAIWLAVQWLAA